MGLLDAIIVSKTIGLCLNLSDRGGARAVEHVLLALVDGVSLGMTDGAHGERVGKVPRK